jgi:hypothetical protein
VQVLVFLVAPLLARHRLERKTRRHFEAAQSLAATLEATELPQQQPT